LQGRREQRDDRFVAAAEQRLDLRLARLEPLNRLPRLQPWQRCGRVVAPEEAAFEHPFD
jgi:hypothetical protein